MIFHSVAPLDAYEDRFRCTCGEVFTVEVGWAFCPKDTGTNRQGWATERARTAPNGLSASSRYDHTQDDNQTAERPAERRGMQTITHAQLAEILSGFWLDGKLDSETLADDIWDSAEALFGPDDGEPPEWTEVHEDNNGIRINDEAERYVYTYFLVVNDGPGVGSGVRYGPFNSRNNARYATQPEWFARFASVNGWHVSAVEVPK